MRPFTSASLGFVVSASLLVSTSCQNDRYQLLERKDGVVVRLDKRTGQIMLVNGTIMNAVAEETPTSHDSILGRTKNWPDQSVPVQGDSALKLSLRTLWRDGRVFYQFTVSPARRLERVLRRSSRFGASFTINLEDAGGFCMLEIEVPVNEMSRIVDNKGDPISFEANSSIAGARDVYASTTRTRISWTL